MITVTLKNSSELKIRSCTATEGAILAKAALKSCMQHMVIPFMEFSREGYKIKKVFGSDESEPSSMDPWLELKDFQLGS